MIIDGCTLLQDNNNESIRPLIKTLNTTTLKPNNSNPKPTGSPNPMMTPVTQDNNKVISLFGDEPSESSNEEESDTEFDFFDF